MKTLITFLTFMMSLNLMANIVECSFTENGKTANLEAEVLPGNKLRLLMLVDGIHIFDFFAEDSDDIYEPAIAQMKKVKSKAIFDFGNINFDDNWSHVYILKMSEYPLKNNTSATLTMEYGDEYGETDDYVASGICQLR
jgi:hypothetical protein